MSDALARAAEECGVPAEQLVAAYEESQRHRLAGMAGYATCPRCDSPKVRSIRMAADQATVTITCAGCNRLTLIADRRLPKAHRRRS